jgi:hypothetical protein
MFNTIVEPEPHRVTAPAPAPTKRCGSLQLRLRNTALNSLKQFNLDFLYMQWEPGLKPEPEQHKNDAAPQHWLN